MPRITRLEGWRCDVVRPAPYLNPLLPMKGRGLRLVQPLQRSVVALVETPVASHRQPQPIQRRHRVVHRRDGPREHRGVHHRRLEAGITDQSASVSGLRLASRGQTDIGPTGEAILEVPRALPCRRSTRVCVTGATVVTRFAATKPHSRRSSVRVERHSFDPARPPGHADIVANDQWDKDHLVGEDLLCQGHQDRGFGGIDQALDPSTRSRYRSTASPVTVESIVPHRKKFDPTNGSPSGSKMVKKAAAFDAPGADDNPHDPTSHAPLSNVGPKNTAESSVGFGVEPGVAQHRHDLSGDRDFSRRIARNGE